jgi:F-type H+-transporting ATPase subunit b
MALKIKVNSTLIVMVVFSVLAISAAIVVTLLSKNIISVGDQNSAMWLQNLVAWTKGSMVSELFWRIANFSVMIIVLHLALTDKAVDFFKNRKLAISEAIDDATETKVTAEKRHEEVLAKFSKAKKEIEDIKSSFIEEGKKERQRLIENAEKEAEKIRVQAKKSIEQELIKAKLAIKTEASDLAIKMAEEILKKNIKKDDLSRMTKEYIEKTTELT